MMVVAVTETSTKMLFTAMALAVIFIILFCLQYQDLTGLIFCLQVT